MVLSSDKFLLGGSHITKKESSRTDFSCFFYLEQVALNSYTIGSILIPLKALTKFSTPLTARIFSLPYLFLQSARYRKTSLILRFPLITSSPQVFWC